MARPSVGEAKLGDASRADLAGALGLDPAEIPAGATVRQYEDGAFGTEATRDLTFEPENWSGLSIFGLGGAALVLLAAMRRRRSAR